MLRNVNDILKKLYQRALCRACVARTLIDSSLKAKRKKVFLNAEKEAYAKSFRRAACDPDVTEMAELGMSDYNDQLNDYPY